VARKFQTATVFETMTVGESMKLASWHGRIPSVYRSSVTASVSPGSGSVLELTDLGRAWGARAKDLNHGQKQALELAMVLAHEPDLLLLDEPTAGLTLEQRNTIGAVLVGLAAAGMCILLVEHDFAFIKSAASRMVVMHGGQIIADGSVEDVSASEAVKRVYLGAQL
jgi:branched-chain amino acid transport system permease protein